MLPKHRDDSFKEVLDVRAASPGDIGQRVRRGGGRGLVPAVAAQGYSSTGWAAQLDYIVGFRLVRSQEEP